MVRRLGSRSSGRYRGVFAVQGAFYIEVKQVLVYPQLEGL